ncbi:dolichyl-phosphate beta-glucosyltransferase wollknaeuel [Rhodnius prolixus]|uniref:Dolichyl-phosphate beta-glucosyltransferase n=1 Tax=Rhodnius prolixus TaxID=13249 RepID=T1HHV7_RHOPR
MDFDILIALCIFGILIFLISLLLCVVFYNTTPYPSIRRSEKEKCYYDTEEKKCLPFPSISDRWAVHLSVIVPAYDEEQRLPPMLDEALDFLEKRREKNKDFKYEIIVSSDGSRDKTVEVALKYSQKYGSDVVRVLDLNPNRGKGGAVRLGVLSCRGAVILFADADGATKFQDLTKLEESLMEITKSNYISAPEKGAEVHALICGSRSHLEVESLARRSLFRNFLMHGFHFLVWSLAVRSIKDTQCGFKLFTRRTAELLFHNIHVERWAFDVELLNLAEKFYIPLAEVAVNWTEIEGSKIVPVLSWIQMGKDLFLIWLRYKLGAWKVALKPT